MDHPFDIPGVIGDSAPMSSPSKQTMDEHARHEQADALLDEALRMTFPASDPVAISFDDATGRDKAAPAAGSDAEPATHPVKEPNGVGRKN